MIKKCSQCKNFERKENTIPDTIKNDVVEWGPILEDITWDQAKLLEIGDWRLPTVAELVSLFDYIDGNPKPRFGPMKGKLFWTYCAVAGYLYNAWHVNFYFGFVHFGSKEDKHSVRLIRNIRTE